MGVNRHFTCYKCDVVHMLSWTRITDQDGIKRDVPMCSDHFKEWQRG